MKPTVFTWLFLLIFLHNSVVGTTINNDKFKYCPNTLHNKYSEHELTDEELFARGHLKPFGSHRPPDGIVEELPYMISPQDFYMNYVTKHKPVVLKGEIK